MEIQAVPGDTPLIIRLHKAYEKVGVTVCSGLNPHLFFNFSPAAFTFFFKDKAVLSQHFGIGLQEVFFLQTLFGVYQPKSMLCVGNGWGWSTLTCALLNPQAKLVALDAALDDDSKAGLELTQRIAQNEGLEIAVVQGKSPDDIPAIVGEHFDGPVDCFFIDALHTNAAQSQDFQIALKYAHPKSLFLFHDVALFGLEPSLKAVASAAGLDSRTLWSTPSGMGAAFHADFSSEGKAVLDAFSPAEEMVSRVWRGARVEASDLVGALELDERQLDLFSRWIQKINLD